MLLTVLISDFLLKVWSSGFPEDLNVPPIVSPADFSKIFQRLHHRYYIRHVVENSGLLLKTFFQFLNLVFTKSCSALFVDMSPTDKASMEEKQKVESISLSL